MLRLQVVDFVGPTRWRWRLTDAEGAVVAEHTVELDDEEWHFAAFADLPGYLRATAEPDRRLAHQAEVVVQVGAWLGERVFGQVALELARAHAPVLLEVPPEAGDLASRPWELALVENQPLAAHGVSFVVDQGPPTAPKADVGARLRMLAVFGRPADESAANPRRQRYTLARSIYRIATKHGLGVQLRVLPYGATRDMLRDALLEAEGWDVVHVAGLAGGLPLADETGRPDLVTPAELADLLAVGARQVKLVTLVETESQTDVADERRRLSGLPQAPTGRPGTRPPAVPTALPALAAAVARQAECATVAVRHPVTEDFAIVLADAYYDLVLGRREPVAAALPRAVTLVAGGSMTAAVPPLSVAAPAVFGASAGDLRLTAPSGEAYVFQAEQQRMVEFPPQPFRFAGRVDALNRASAVLTEHSGLSGLALHGTAGVGKTALALELAYTHQDAFAGVAWYAAPPVGHDVSTTLTDCALALERQLPGLRLANRAHDPEAWRAALPALTEGLDQARVLIVLDGVDSLLTETGEWRDELWAEFVRAITDHGGRSRVLLTSRRPLAGLPETVLADAVPALSDAETVTLALAWPRLRTLLEGNHPDLPADQARELAGRTLTVVHGHPTLLALAEGAATHPTTLRARLDEAERKRAEDGTEPEVLAGWVEATVQGLPADAALFFRFLCCLEPDDRADWVVTPTWPTVWQGQGDAPGPESLGQVLAGHGLFAAETGYRIEAAVAETGRRLAGAEFAATVDRAAADGWLGTLRDALGRQGEDLGWLVGRAATAAMPYLERLGRWRDVVAAADQVLRRDRGTATAAALLPHLLGAFDVLRDTDDELAAGLAQVRASTTVDPELAGLVLLHLVDVATGRGDFPLAAALVAELVDISRLTGRWEECLRLADTLSGHADRPGMGPWFGLLLAHTRLRIRFAQGQYEEVLAEVTGLDTDLPEPPPAVVPWAVRETIAGLGAAAARELRRWPEALELAAVVARSQADRDAPEAERAATAFADHVPLLELGRADEARELLTHCRTLAEAAGDGQLLGRTLSALAEVEARAGEHGQAVELATESLRCAYRLANPEWVALGHRDLADRLAAAEADGRTVAAHLLAGALLEYQTGSRRLAEEVKALAMLPPEESSLTFDEICLVVDRTPGIGFAALFTRLPGKTGTGQGAVDGVRRFVGQLRQEAVDEAVRQAVEAWEPVVAGLREPAAAEAVDQAFAAFESHPDWQDLVAVLRGIRAGEDPEVDSLTPVGAAVAERARDVVAGRAHVDPEAWRALIEQE